MLLAGDELSHTQRGNNNAYCQDNDLTWLDWNLDDRQKQFLAFARRCAQIFREQPVLQRRKFFQGRAIRGAEVRDLTFFEPYGREMSDQAWHDPHVKCLGLRLAGDLINDVDDRGEPIVGDTLLLLLNAHWEEIPFTLPQTSDGAIWETLVDTSDLDAPLHVCRPGEPYPLFGRSLALLRTNAPKDAGTLASERQIENLRREARQVPKA